LCFCSCCFVLLVWLLFPICFHGLRPIWKMPLGSLLSILSGIIPTHQEIFLSYPRRNDPQMRAVPFARSQSLPVKFLFLGTIWSKTFFMDPPCLRPHKSFPPPPFISLNDFLLQNVPFQRWATEGFRALFLIIHVVGERDKTEEPLSFLLPLPPFSSPFRPHKSFRCTVCET